MLVPRDSTRIVYNRRFEGRGPTRVVQVENTADVAAAVRWADRFDVRVVARSGGHSYAGYSTTGTASCSTCLALRGVRVSSGRATVGPGAQLIDVQRALTRRGADRAVRLVPVRGHRRPRARRRARPGRAALRAHERQPRGRARGDRRRPRAARGRRHERGPLLGLPGRGRRELRHRHLADPEGRTARPRAAWFSVSWPWSQAEEALAAWQRFAPEAPPALTSIFSLGTTGGSGPPRVAALGQYFGERRRRCAGSSGRSRGWRAPASAAAARATSRWCCAGPAASTAASSACHRSTRSSFFAKSDYFDKRLGPRGRAIMIDWIERRQRNPSLGSGALLLDAYGGALNRPAADATAFVHRDMLFSLQYLAYFNGGAAGRASRRWINGVWRALRPHVSGEAYQNYIDPQLDGWQRAYYGANLERLREIKKQVDPDFRFRFRQAIPPAR